MEAVFVSTFLDLLAKSLDVVIAADSPLQRYASCVDDLSVFLGGGCFVHCSLQAARPSRLSLAPYFRFLFPLLGRPTVGFGVPSDSTLRR